jgi:16S rRNA (adenine1518-N6/adenine1519-N6)-dimethyltransferase
MAKGRKHTNSHRSKASSNGVQAKKYLGQHFLKDENIAEKIASILLLKETNQVLEIGPGTGVMTKYLVEQDIDLIAMDLDKESIDYLNEEFKPLVALQSRTRSFEVVYADFLKFDLDQLFPGLQFAIIGNFPYNISSQIIFKTLENRERIPEFSGMFQKEVAKRICAGPGSKTYGILSVLVQAYYEAEYLFTVPPGVFNPPPKVDSGVLRLIRKEHQDLGCDDRMFFKVVKTAFNQRRKTLRNSLKSMIPNAIVKEDVIFDKRPEALGVDEFVSLTKKLSDDTI